MKNIGNIIKKLEKRNNVKIMLYEKWQLNLKQIHKHEKTIDRNLYNINEKMGDCLIF